MKTKKFRYKSPALARLCGNPAHCAHPYCMCPREEMCKAPDCTRKIGHKGACNCQRGRDDDGRS